MQHGQMRALSTRHCPLVCALSVVQQHCSGGCRSAHVSLRLGAVGRRGAWAGAQAGRRLRAPVPAARGARPDRRQRPVGQHHCRCHPAAAAPWLCSAQLRGGPLVCKRRRRQCVGGPRACRNVSSQQCPCDVNSGGTAEVSWHSNGARRRYARLMATNEPCAGAGGAGLGWGRGELHRWWRGRMCLGAGQARSL